MAGPNAGWFSFPGVGCPEAISFVDQSGVAPASGTMRILVSGGLPAQDGNLVFYYNGQGVTTIQNVHIDSVDFETNSGGQVATIRFVDERWTWDKAFINGKYNFRIPNNWIDPAHEQTPQQLAMLCFQALGVVNFDVSQLPNDSRPEVDWVSANPAQELEKICSDLGCRVVPQRSTGSWIVWPTGVGTDLPDYYPYEDWGQGIDPKEVPDFIKIVTAPWRYQVNLPISPRIKDFDLSWQTLTKVSYCQDKADAAGGFGKSPFDLKFLYSAKVTFPDGTTGGGSVRWITPDGTKISAIELATDSAFRCWSVDFSNQSGAVQQGGDWYMTFPGIPIPVNVRQLILTDKLVQSYTDYLGVQHQRSSFMWGQFFVRQADGATSNTPPGTRIDKQWEHSSERQDERASFSLSLDPIDTTRSIISVSTPMVFQQSSGATYPFTSAKLSYMCAVNVRDPNTWQPLRYEYLYQVGSGTNQNFCTTIVRDDIQPWTIQQSGQRTGPPFTNNLSEVQNQCLYYAQSAARELVTTASGKRTYIGIFPIDMDGQIQQITYSIDGRGTSMQASQGTEHNWYTPEFEERRRQIARQGLSARMEFIQYELERRDELKGRYNT